MKRLMMTLRLAPAEKAAVSEITNVLASSLGERVTHSRFLRELIHAETCNWLLAPYFCTKASHLVVVLADGTVLYRLRQALFLNDRRDRLPFSISMKPEKQTQLLRDCASRQSPAETLRKNWLINHFAAWNNSSAPAGPPHVTHVDRLGLLAKSADLAIGGHEGKATARELIVGLRDYVQRTSDDDQGVTRDRADIPVDIPTLNLEVFLLVDQDLYANCPNLLGPVACELRNREEARFSLPLVTRVGTSENPLIWNEERFPNAVNEDRLREDILRSVRDQFLALQSRVRLLSSKKQMAPDGRPVVDDPDSRLYLSALRLPERYLFGRLQWLWPHQGLQTCVSWPKPRQVAQTPE